MILITPWSTGPPPSRALSMNGKYSASSILVAVGNPSKFVSSLVSCVDWAPIERAREGKLAAELLLLKQLNAVPGRKGAGEGPLMTIGEAKPEGWGAAMGRDDA